MWRGVICGECVCMLSAWRSRLHSLYLKAKESYHARCVEYDKMKRENASPKDLDKIEAKYKKASESPHFHCAELS